MNLFVSKDEVLILVLVEHTLGGDNTWGANCNVSLVLILVLVEHTLGGANCNVSLNEKQS